MAKIDIKSILVTAATAAASAAAAQTSTAMQPKDVPVVVEAAKDHVAANPDIKKIQDIVNAKTNQEPWYQSIQAWVTILTSLMALLGAVGLAVPEDVQKQVLAAVPLIVGLVGAGMLIYNRYFRFKGPTA